MTYVLGWMGKPASPLAYAEEDVWFFSEDEEKQDGLDIDFPFLTRNSLDEQLFEDFETSVKTENDDAFSQWLEEKAELPIFDEVEPVLPAEEPKCGREIDKGSLTPPQSPPNVGSETYLIFDSTDFQNSIDSDMVCHPCYVSACDEFAESSGENRSPDNFLTAPPTPVPDLEKEMAVVDEMVRGMAQNLESKVDVWESENQRCQSNSSESMNNIGSPVSGGAEEESDDPEWTPTAKKPAKRSDRRAKPYSQQDRWLRKKEQNKKAATRYRQKKKAEASEIFEEEKMLEKKNGKLQQRVCDIQFEIKYLKGLMRDFFKAKGLLIN